MAEQMSAKDVVLKQLNRSRVTRVFGTPSEDATPRTLIRGLLGAASINKSGLHVTDLAKKSRLKKSPQVPPPKKRRVSLRKSLGDNATPRTLIRNYLMEASPETPLEIPQQTLITASPGKKKDENIQNSIFQDEDTNSPLLSLSKTVDAQVVHTEDKQFSESVDSQERAEGGHFFKRAESLGQSEDDQLFETADSQEHAKGGHFSKRADSQKHTENDQLCESPESQVHTEDDQLFKSADSQGHTQDDELSETADSQEHAEDELSETVNSQEYLEDDQLSESAKSQGHEEDEEFSQKGTEDSQVLYAEDDQLSETADSQDEKPTAQAVSPHDISPGISSYSQSNINSSAPLVDENDLREGSSGNVAMVTDSLMTLNKSSKWKDLVTPYFPVTKRKVLHEPNELDGNTSKQKRTRRSAIKRKQPIRTAVSKRTSSDNTNLPSSLVKSIFQHFSKRRVTKDTLQTIQKGSSLFFKQASADLMAYCQHAGRVTIEINDVELLMKRQGFVTSKQSLHSLIEKYLPMEYRQELIPVAQSGNKIILKKSHR